MKIKKVQGNTFYIDTGMTYIPFYKINEEEVIMLDTGWAKGEREKLDNLFEENKLRISGIICSHFHVDHIGNVSYFKEKYNCVVAMPAYEAFVCSSVVNLKVYYSGQTLSDVNEHYGHMVCKTDIMISDNQDSVSVKNIEFKIMHTPGHSPSHICIITPDNVAYLGDSLISYEVMAGAKMPYAYILNEDLKSKKKLYALNCNKYIVAHKGMYDDITKLITDNIHFYKNRAKGVYSVIDGVMSSEDIFKAAIKKFEISVRNKYKYSLMERMIKSYIEYLNETGSIKLIIESGLRKYSKASQVI